MDYMTQWVVEREKELDRVSPFLQLRFPLTGYTIDQVKGAVHTLAGVEPQEMKLLDEGFFEIICRNVEDSKKIRNLNGRCVLGDLTPILVQCKEHVLGVNDIFEVVREKV